MLDHSTVLSQLFWSFNSIMRVLNFVLFLLPNELSSKRLKILPHSSFPNSNEHSTVKSKTFKNIHEVKLNLSLAQPSVICHLENFPH